MDATEQGSPGATTGVGIDAAVRSVAGGIRDAVRLVWRAARVDVAVLVLGALVVGVLPIGLAWLSKSMLDGLGAAHPDGRWLLTIAALMVLAGLVSAAVPYLLQYATAELGRRVTRVAQAELAGALRRLRGLARLEDPAFYDRLRLATQAGRAGPGQIFGAVLAIAQGAVTTGGFLIALAALNPWLVAFAVLAALPSLRLQLVLSRHRTAMMVRLSGVERREMFYEGLLTRLDAAKEIRLLRLGDFFILRMLRELSAIHAEQRRMDRRQLVSYLGMAVLSAAVAGASIVWAVRAAVAGRLTIGDIAIVVAASAGVLGGLSSAIERLGALHQSLALFGHYRAVLAARPDLPVPECPRAVGPLRRGIELDDVWFRYSPQHPWVLRGVHLVIPAGRAVGLVGLNGSGKSTLIKLLCRFYDPDRGAIRWDGVDLRELPVEQLRDRIGAVFQDFMDYDMSAAENIGVGDLDRLDDRAAVTAAATRAGVHDTIQALPRGYDTLLTRMFFGPDGEEPGLNLSGGQWQRIALARGLLRHGRDLLILDEPSSGLDAEAEHQIHARLRAMRTGRTSVLISHRLSAVRDAEVIAVLADGRIVEQGTHDGLLATDGPYARLFELQARGYRDGAVTTAGRDGLG